jgi:hypothetical protein
MVEFYKRQCVAALAWRLQVLKSEHTKNHGASTIRGVKRFRKDVTVLPAPGSLTCSVCNASYESITKLREHQSMSHRRGGTEEGPRVAVVVQSEDPELS